MGTVDPNTKRKRRTPPRKASGARTVSVADVPEWAEFRQTIIGALRPYPEAYDAVLAVILKRMREDEARE